MSESAPAPSRLLEGAEVFADPLVRELLELRLVAVLGTVARDCLPHLTPVWFARDGGGIAMTTGSASQKVAYLEREPRAALVLHDSRAGFEVCGVSMTGLVEIVRGAEATPLVERVHDRYVERSAATLAAVAEFLASDDVALRFTPERAWTWDQRRTEASRRLRTAGGALPLAPTSPRGSADL